MSKKFRLIPSVLYKMGSVVKSIQYQNHRVVGDLPSTIRVFSRRQADELIIFDLDASKSGEIDWLMVSACVENSNMPLTYGGGVKSVDVANELICNGFDKISFNTALYDDPESVYQVARLIGSSSTIASVDLKLVDNIPHICYQSGTKILKKFDPISVISDFQNIGIGEIIVNQIDDEGLMNGYKLDTFRVFLENAKIPILISGGCSGADCIKRAYNFGFSGAVMSSIFLWKGDSIPSLKDELSYEIPVRKVVK